MWCIVILCQQTTVYSIVHCPFVHGRLVFPYDSEQYCRRFQRCAVGIHLSLTMSMPAQLQISYARKEDSEAGSNGGRGGVAL